MHVDARGNLQGAYFAASDLPADPEVRDAYYYTSWGPLIHVRLMGWGVVIR
jgi:hypothetical protein